MPWFSPKDCLRFVGQAKLAALTVEADERKRLGVGDGAAVAFTTPYFGGKPVVYVNGAVVVPPVFAFSDEVAPPFRRVVTFAVAPMAGAVIEVSSTSSIDVEVLNEALLKGQADIRGYLKAAGYQVPADDSTSVPAEIKGWSWDIAAFNLGSDVRRLAILESNPGIVARYEAVMARFKAIAAGDFSLAGILPPIVTPPDATSSEAAAFVSNPRVFTDRAGAI